jgi:predicted Ser/Thr protein kinase
MNETDNLPKMIGRYEIKRLLGAGAMGSVYLAEDLRIKRKLAIKVVKLDAIRNESDRSDFLARFQREAEVSGVLNDPGIVTIYDVGDSEVGPFLAMEFVAGKPLDAYVKSGEMLSMDLGTKLRMAAGIAAALDHAHSHGIVHRDVKPGNVMITEDGRPKLMDFGIAKREDTNLTQTGTFLGTPSYASPEQIKEGHATTRSDTFSFGVMVFEMLSGTLPFPGTSINTILYKIVNEPPLEIKPPVLGLLPEGWQRIFTRVLAKNADERYPTCAAFIRDILDATTELDKDLRLEIMGLLKLSGPGAPPPILSRAHEETMYMPPAKARKSGSGLFLGLGIAALLGLGVGGFLLFQKSGTSVTLQVEPAGKVFSGSRELGPTGVPLPIKVGEKVTVKREGFEPLDYIIKADETAPKMTLKPRITAETLRTIPEGATAVLDGKALEGATPISVKDWDQSKKHDLTFTHKQEGKTRAVQFHEGEAPGNEVYQLVSDAEAATNGEVKTIDANAPGFLKVTGEFSVRVWLNNKDLGEAGGNAKVSLEPGTYKLELRSPKVFYKGFHSVTIRPGQPSSVSLPDLANITVETFPASGIVVIDGIPTSVESDGSSPIRVVKGQHTVSIQGRGGSHAVDVKGDQPVKFKI